MSFKSTVLFSSLCVAVLAAPMANVFAQDQGGIPGIKPAAVETKMTEEEMIKKASTILIYNQLGQMLVALKQDGIELDQEAAIEGARRALAGEPLGITMDEAQSVMKNLQQKAEAGRAKLQAEMMTKMKEMAAKNDAEGKAYFAENAKKPTVKTLLDGGVQYEVMVAGTGAKPQPTDKVKINYHGTYVNGEVFDSTLGIEGKKPAAPFTNSASGFVPGFNAALQSMTVGSKWKIAISGDQGYGLQGRGPIGPNQTILFEVELLEIVDGAGSGTAPSGGQ